MSTEPRTTSDNQALTNLPAPSDLSDNDRQRLVQLFDRASAAHKLVTQAAIEFCRHSIEAGVALLEAHDLCPKKCWGAWLKDHFNGSARTARRYMQQAKTLLTRGSRTDLAAHPSEELAWQFTDALIRLERRRAAALPSADNPANDAPVSECVKDIANEASSVGRQPSVSTPANDRAQAIACQSSSPPPKAHDDPLKAISGLFDQLIAALDEAIASGQRLDYGQYVLDELKRLRDDVDACGTLLRDAHTLNAVFV